MAANTIASSLAEKIRSFSTVDTNRACFDGRCGKDKCSSNKESREINGTIKKKFLCNECGQRKELLHIWRIWTFG